MAVDPVANLYVQLGMDVARLQGDVQKATTILDNFQRKVDRGFASIGRGMGITAAGAAIVGFLHKAVQEASIAEQAVTQLNTSLANLGTKRVGDINLVSAAIQRMAKEMQKATGFTDEEIMRGASRLLAGGIGTQDLQLATEAATNLARAYNIELEPAMQAVLQAYWGQSKGIKKLIPEIGEMLKEGERGADVLAKMNDMLGPHAAAQADTYAGKIRALRVESDEFAESLGKKVIPALTGVLQFLNGLKNMDWRLIAPLDEYALVAEKVQQKALEANLSPSQLEKLTGGASWNHPLVFGKPGKQPKVEGKPTKEKIDDRGSDYWQRLMKSAKQEADQEISYRNRIIDLDRQIAVQETELLIVKGKATELDRANVEMLYREKKIGDEIVLLNAVKDSLVGQEREKITLRIKELERERDTLRVLNEIEQERLQYAERLRTDAVAGTEKALGDLQKHYQSQGRLMEDFTLQTFMRMEDAFVQFCDTGKFEFKDFVRQTLIQLNRLFFQITVLEPMANRLRAAMQGIGSGGFGGGGGGFGGFGNMFAGLGGLFGGAGAAMEGLAVSSSFLEGLGAFSMFLVGKGAAFDNGRALRRYARGGIVHAPTVFPMASGMGLMGEAGPEAVIPLKRTASGDLGVQAGAGGPLVGAIHIHAADAQSFYDMCRRNPAAITDPVKRALQSNQDLRHVIMRTAK